jgi:hypothetical protein
MRRRVRSWSVPEYLVEAYVSQNTTPGNAPGIDEVSLAAHQLTREGIPVRFLHSIYVPEDETAFYLFQALSVEAVHEAAARAGLQVEHISEAISATPAQAENGDLNR